MMVRTIVSILVICFIQYGGASAAAAEWHQFPQMRHVDEFSHCVGAEGGVYCTAELEFVAEGPNKLYDAMIEYSKPTSYRFNRTKAIHGYCMTKRCKEFLTGDTSAALKTAFGACLNSTLQREYGLRARIDSHLCYRHGERPTASYLDWAAAALLLVFVAMVAAGTFYDLFVTNKDSQGYLVCFSLSANWAKLTAPWPQNPATARLVGLNGIRTITNLYIIGIHAYLVGYYNINPDYLEAFHHSTFWQIFIQSAAVVMQTFFFLSGLLLAYNMERSNEKSPKTWRSLPKAILLRWLRLAPPVCALILFSLTWQRFCPFSPLYQKMHRQVEDCRKNWQHFFFLSINYVKKWTCNAHLWSTAVDLQLHIIGLSIMLLSPTKRVRNSLLWILLIIGLVLPALETYFRNLAGDFLIFPDLIDGEKIVLPDSFTYLYSPTHCNIPSFMIGMLLGLQLHDWQKNPIDFTKYKKYTILYWLLFPALLLVSFWNVVLFTDWADMSTRLLIAVLRKPAWTVALTLLTVGMIYKVETPPLYRRVLEWGGWVPLARLSYCSYNIHVPIIYWYISSSLTLFTGSDLHFAIAVSGIIVISLLAAMVLWLVVEAPCTNVVAKLFPEKQTSLRVSDKIKAT